MRGSAPPERSPIHDGPALPATALAAFGNPVQHRSAYVYGLELTDRVSERSGGLGAVERIARPAGSGGEAVRSIVANGVRRDELKCRPRTRLVS